MQQITPGLMLTHISSVRVDHLPYAEVLGLLKAAGRPVELSFAQPDAGPLSPASHAHEMQRQEEQEVAQSSLQPVTRRRSSAEQILQLAQDEERVLQQNTNQISVTFGEPGSIGISFGSISQDHPAFIRNIKAGGQADRSGRLREHLYLVSVNGQTVTSFKRAMSAIKSSGRPISLLFSNQEPKMSESMESPGMLSMPFDLQVKMHRNLPILTYCVCDRCRCHYSFLARRSECSAGGTRV